MTVLITLTLAGTDVGPFDLYSNADGYTTPFELGVSRAALIAGYTSTLVPVDSTEILAQSTGVCSRDLYMLIEGAPTTTTTTSSTTSTTSTTTTTAGPVEYTIDSFGTGSSFDACTTGNPTVSVYALPGYTSPIVTMIFYDSPSLTTPYVGGAGWRKFTYDGLIFYAGEVDINGELTNYVTC